MVDFKKLLAQTPEERAERVRKFDEEYEATQTAKLQQRAEALRSMVQWRDSSVALSDFDRKFITNMESLSTQPDIISDRIAGKLLYLTDPQVESFNRIGERARVAMSPTPSASQAPWPVRPQCPVPRSRP
jgi:hypothetical protein